MDIKKLENFYYKKLREEKAQLLSFSSCNEFRDCPFLWKLGKIDRLKGGDNIYTKGGSLTHEMVENIYESNDIVDNNKLTKMFDEEMGNIFMEGYGFASEKIREGWMVNMRKYFENFQKNNQVIGCEVFCSFPFATLDKKLVDLYFQGWIDCVLEDENGDIHIGDFKSSTKFSEADIKKSKGKQLVLYAIAYEYMYGKRPKTIFFDFMKYAKLTDEGKSRIVERRDVDSYTYDTMEHAYVFVDLTDEIIDEAKQWLLQTYYDMQTAKLNNDFPLGTDKQNGRSFFCNTLCGMKKYKLCGNKY
ncbi:MAG: PD-(D/E)XK nuclease family protein [Clostridium sp.]|uniref:PD-(D/E)XK nuclease family protein n=1 Tax=Clostridium sp. TaxID=1506 RepID=UPI003EE7E50C